MPETDLGVSENWGYLICDPYSKILLFRVLYLGPLFSETPIFNMRMLFTPSETNKNVNGVSRYAYEHRPLNPKP